LAAPCEAKLPLGEVKGREKKGESKGGDKEEERGGIR
jgi:hypothetical protein